MFIEKGHFLFQQKWQFLSIILRKLMSCVNSIDFLTKFPNYIGLFIFKFEIHGLMLERIYSKLKGYLFF